VTFLTVKPRVCPDPSNPHGLPTVRHCATPFAASAAILGYNADRRPHFVDTPSATANAVFSIVDGVLLKTAGLPRVAGDLVSIRESWRQLADRVPTLEVNEQHFELLAAAYANIRIDGAVTSCSRPT